MRTNDNCERVEINGCSYVREDTIPQDPAVAGPWRVGAAYLIRTVMMAWTGKIRAVYPHEIVLDKAACVAWTGRYHEATTPDALSEVEPAGDGIVIGRGSIVDARPWSADLPDTVK